MICSLLVVGCCWFVVDCLLLFDGCWWVVVPCSLVSCLLVVV